ncbi:MAG: hypothetical protein AMJ93_14105 [Anaerolineae bacterium SM23_84]|nr:MAG: hypothetical protein AMJ93_14105 [Anaerolineae bacterium SM23_84]
MSEFPLIVPGLLLIDALLFWAVSVSLNSLATKNKMWRLHVTTRYAIGCGMMEAIFIVFCLSRYLGGDRDALAYIAFSWAVKAVSGAVVKLHWRFATNQPVEQWNGMGEKRLRNPAIALLENARAWRAVQKDALLEAMEAMEKADAYDLMLRYFKSDDALEGQSVQALRRIVAERMGREE